MNQQKQEPSKPRGRPSRRPQIIAAAESLIRSQGLASVTTRAIAAEVGCSEGALYVHFKGRLQLLLAVLEESLPDMVVPLQTLEQSVGKATPKRNLEKALRAMFTFHTRVAPMLCALFADPELLAAYRKSLANHNKGPHRAVCRIRGYIRAEQELGRIHKDIDAQSAATMLMAGSFFHTFVEQFTGKADRFDAFSKALLASVLRG